MKKVTDKYQVFFKGNDKYHDQLFDIKEVPKRAYQLGIASLIAGIGMSIYNAYLGLYVSSFLVACFCFIMLMLIVLRYKEAIFNLPIFIVSMVCGLLIAAALLEGLQAEQYLLFFPLLIAVPIVIDLKKTSYAGAFIYIFIILASFGICILIGHSLPHFETSYHKQITKLAFLNRVLAITSTIVFAISYIFFEKKYIHELMAQSKRVIDSRTQFLATMGHELRTPLNGIVGTVNLLKQEQDYVRQQEYIQVLKYCADHMLQQVNDILDYNKIEAGKLEIHPEEVNLKRLLTNIGLPFTSMLKEKGVEFMLEIDDELNTNILADDLRLVQIINNLLSNALKFTEKGYVKLRAFCKAKEPQFMLVGFTVEDTGIGIAKEDQDMIFEGFQQIYNESTKKIIGTGLGLTICVKLLKLMNSTFTLISDKGKGSRFNFDLKFEYPDTKKQMVVSERAAENLSGVKLLLVEDNQINMMIAQKILTGFKAKVTRAFNGKEALDQLHEDAQFDMILMDLEMPVMNGYTAIYEMKQLYPAIPVLAFTASLVDQEMLADLVESGFADCLLKPFQPQQLLSSIKKYLKNSIN